MIIHEGMIVCEGMIVHEGIIVCEGTIILEETIVHEGTIICGGTIIHERMIVQVLMAFMLRALLLLVLTEKFVPHHLTNIFETPQIGLITENLHTCVIDVKLIEIFCDFIQDKIKIQCNPTYEASWLVQSCPLDFSEH